MEVRRATIENLKTIQELSLKLFEKEYDDYDNKSLNMDWSFDDNGTKYFKKRLTEDDSCVFVVMDGDKVVGYLAGGDVEMNWRDFSKAGYLDNMFVLEGYRGKGVGRMLYGAFVDWCKEKGLKNIRVGALFKNKGAIGFYEKMGFGGYELFLESKI